MQEFWGLIKIRAEARGLADARSQGSWSGKGLKKRKSHPSRIIVKPGGIDPATRSDYARENVIISEKKDKKASAFLVKDLPYPYTSKAQYEKRFEAPVGSEWNSRSGYQRGTLPRVIKKVSCTSDVRPTEIGL